MFKRRSALVALVFTGLASLACSGLGLDAGNIRTKAAHGPRHGGKLKVADSNLRKNGKRDRKPSSAAMNHDKRKNEYVVKLRPGVTQLDVGGKHVRTKNTKLDQAFGSLNLTSSSKVHAKAARDSRLSKYLGLDRTVHIRTKASEEEVRKRLEAHPDVEWVEPVVEVKRASTPNDPYFSYQWHMQMLDVTKAWETTMGEGVVVAVVDTGVSVGEDGFNKLLPGWDFVDNDADPSDLNAHGTHVAGTIGQAADNGIGVVGVAPKVSILPVRVLDAYGSGSNTWVANGIIWAVDNGANIINLSLGSQMNSEVVADACAYAYEKGVTVIAATGNDGFVDYIGYPAALESTIAVGSVDAKKTVAFYSNQGQQIDLVAPGGDTTVDTNSDGQGDGVVQETVEHGTNWSYSFFQGTSMATPHVAGVAALLYANGITEPDAIREALTSTADDLGKSGWDTVYGHGLVNPVAALKAGPGKVAGGGKLKIEKTRGKVVGESRAVIGWITNEPSSTMIKGSDGFKDKIDTPVKMHRVAVSGKRGSTVTYTIRSMKGREAVTDKVTVTF